VELGPTSVQIALAFRELVVVMLVVGRSMCVVVSNVATSSMLIGRLVPAGNEGVGDVDGDGPPPQPVP
jgi:hypothetical protein